MVQVYAYDSSKEPTEVQNQQAGTAAAVNRGDTFPKFHGAHSRAKANFGRTTSSIAQLPDNFTPEHVHTMLETMRATTR